MTHHLKADSNPKSCALFPIPELHLFNIIVIIQSTELRDKKNQISFQNSRLTDSL